MKEIIISIHIPKTGGITLKNILSKVYDNGCIWLTKTNSARTAFERLMTFDLEKVECVHGHIGYGIHEYLEPLGVKCKYITFVRNPYKRLLSYYNYIFTGPVNEQYKWNESAGWSLDIEFIDWLQDIKLACQDNEITRFLSGCENLNTDKIQYFMKYSDYVLAKKHLENIFFVGSMDSFDNSIFTLSKLLDWKYMPKYGKDNSHQYPKCHNNMNDLEYSTINILQPNDINLYNEIRNKFLE